MRGLLGVALERRQPRQHVAAVEHVGGDDLAAPALLAHRRCSTARRAGRLRNSGWCLWFASFQADIVVHPRVALAQDPHDAPVLADASAGRWPSRRECWLIVSSTSAPRACAVRHPLVVAREVALAARGRRRRAAAPGWMPSCLNRGSCHMPTFWSLDADRERVAAAGAASRRRAARASGEEAAEAGHGHGSSAAGRGAEGSWRPGRPEADSASDA